MRRIFYSILMLIAGIGFSTANAQHMIEVDANLQLPHHKKGIKIDRSALRTTGLPNACTGDTVFYPSNKATGLAAISINNATSAQQVSQMYDCPQDMTVFGFEFFAWSSSLPVVNVGASIYLAGPDSMPMGAPLSTVTVAVDSNFGAGDLYGDLYYHAAFNPPVQLTAGQDFVLVYSNLSANNTAVVCNDYASGDGAGEWLAGIDLFGTWSRPYTINVGGSPFDADWLFQPLVSYNVDAGFTVNPACVPAPNTNVVFTNTSSGAVGNRMYNLAAFLGLERLSHTYDFDDATPAVNAVDTNHTYAMAGTYTPTLTDTIYLWSAAGICYDTDSIVMAGAPNATFSTSANNLVVDFTDMTAGAPTAWLWDFGDGNTSTSQNPQHTYAMPGTYTVCLAIVDACGTDSSCSSVTVSCAAPVAGFTSSANQLTVDFTDVTTGTNVNGWLWDFGDGNTSTMQNPTHTYALDGTYTVCLTATDDCGTDSTCTSVSVVSIGLENALGANSFDLYPNPAENLAYVGLNLETESDVVVTVYNVLGAAVKTVELNDTMDARVELDLNTLGAGTYLVEVRTEQGRAVKRLNVIR